MAKNSSKPPLILHWKGNMDGVLPMHPLFDFCCLFFCCVAGWLLLLFDILLILSVHIDISFWVWLSRSPHWWGLWHHLPPLSQEASILFGAEGVLENCKNSKKGTLGVLAEVQLSTNQSPDTVMMCLLWPHLQGKEERWMQQHDLLQRWYWRGLMREESYPLHPTRQTKSSWKSSKTAFCYPSVPNHHHPLQ